MPERQATNILLDPIPGNQEHFLPADATIHFVRVEGGKIELVGTSFYFPGGPPAMLWVFSLVSLVPPVNPFMIIGGSAPTREICAAETDNGPFLVLATPPQPE